MMSGHYKVGPGILKWWENRYLIFSYEHHLALRQFTAMIYLDTKLSNETDRTLTARVSSRFPRLSLHPVVHSSVSRLLLFRQGDMKGPSSYIFLGSNLLVIQNAHDRIQPGSLTRSNVWAHKKRKINLHGPLDDMKKH